VRRTLRPGDPEWPHALGELGPLPAPELLHAEGRPLDASLPAVAVVGTRRPTGAGVDAARALARGFDEAGWVVVSGLAVGIDAAAHGGALEAGGCSIAVLGCGLDVDYPAANRALRRRLCGSGTVLSEYGAQAPPARHHFPRRNRLIAGLSLGVVVVEGGRRSGALVTARLALEANRSVYAVPGSIRNPMAEGPNELIRTSSAALVTGVVDVFEDLAPALVHSPPPIGGQAGAPRPDDAERALLGELDDAPQPPDVLGGRLGLAPGRLAALLSQLEVKGWAARTGGAYALTGTGARARAAPR